jgi:flavodoxin
MNRKPFVLLLAFSLIAGLGSCKTAPVHESSASAKITFEKIDTGKKILVVYFSKTGHTERVARDIAAATGADIERIQDKKDRSGCIGLFAAARDGRKENSTEIEPARNDPSKYDLVIIGSPVWAWNMTPATRTYVEQNRSKLKEVAFFITAGSTKADEVEPYMEKLCGRKMMCCFGLVEDELENPEAYRAKVQGFLDRLKNK